jgi:hypothetical protein
MASIRTTRDRELLPTTNPSPTAVPSNLVLEWVGSFGRVGRRAACRHSVVFSDWALTVALLAAVGLLTWSHNETFLAAMRHYGGSN